MATQKQKLQKVKEIKTSIKNVINANGGNVGEVFSEYPLAIETLFSGGNKNGTLEDRISGTPYEYYNDKVINIAEYGFAYDYAVEKISLSNLETAGNKAFQYCQAKEFALPKLREIGEYCFGSIGSTDNLVEHLYLPELVTVGKYAFSSAKIKRLSLPKLITPSENMFGSATVETVEAPLLESLSNKMFQYSNGVKNFIAPSVKKLIGSESLYGTEIETISFPLLSDTGRYSHTFYNCTELKSAYLPKWDSSAAQQFNYCTSLESVCLLALSNYNNYFANCYSLKAVIGLSDEGVASLYNTDVFKNCYHILGTVNATYNPEGLKDGYIYVENHLVDTYKSSTNWSVFADQIKPLSELPQEYKDLYNLEIPSDNTRFFELDGIRYPFELGMTWQEWINSDYNTYEGFSFSYNVYKDGKSIARKGVSLIYDAVIHTTLSGDPYYTT